MAAVCCRKYTWYYWLFQFQMGMPAWIAFAIILLSRSIAGAQKLKTSGFELGPFDNSHYDSLAVVQPAMISNGALQVTPDSAGNFSLAHRSGRVLFNRPFKLWEGDGNGRVASFNSSFLINIFRLNNDSAPGEGFAFIIAPDLNLPPGSDGEYLGLTNSTTDGNPNNHLIAVELDTFKQDFDSDDNHIGLDINSIRSNRTVSLSDLGIQIAPLDPKNYSVWVEYDGENKVMDVYMVEEGNPRPAEPVMSAEVELREIVKQYSYMGFAASTGNATQLNCVLQWNLTVELLEEDGDAEWVKVVLGAGVPAIVVVLIACVFLWYYVQKRRRAKSDPNILGTLRSLPGTPREFEFKDLKKATNNFDEKLKLGEGGFGVVYKGLLPKEHVHVAVKKFSRDVKGKDDFLAELTIINRLRHKHLVPLLGMSRPFLRISFGFGIRRTLNHLDFVLYFKKSKLKFDIY